MKKTTFIALAAAACAVQLSVAPAAKAQTAAPAPAAAPAAAPEASPLTFNIGAVTEYRYRGISQSRLKPALQGGFDVTQGAFYLGAWASTINWIKDSGGKANTEIDIYGGVKGDLAKDTAYDIGVLTYSYPSNGLNPSANTVELYGALTFGPVTAKYSHSTSNLFGFANSKGSGYLDLTGTFEAAGLTIAPHIGYQAVKKNGAYSYSDYSLTVSKEISGVTWSGALVGTSTKAYLGPTKQNLGKASVVLGAKYNF
ncbi:MAG: hypothetical protein RI949_126 [Pseudomonadota bacterium]|jgi:uncharacterized protein (TIGR02001 family)